MERRFRQRAFVTSLLSWIDGTMTWLRYSLYTLASFNGKRVGLMPAFHTTAIAVDSHCICSSQIAAKMSV